MSVFAALRTGLAALYRHSIPLIAYNMALTAVTVAVLWAASYAQLALVGLLAIGPMLTAMMHLAAVAISTDDPRPADVLEGLRVHWKHGLILGGLVAIVAAAGWRALTFYFGADARMPVLGFLAGYLLWVFAALQLILWPLAVTEPLPIGGLLRSSIGVLMQRPATYLGLAAALAVLCIVATLTVVPLLTVFTPYACLVATASLPNGLALEARPGRVKYTQARRSGRLSTRFKMSLAIPRVRIPGSRVGAP